MHHVLPIYKTSKIRTIILLTIALFYNSIPLVVAQEFYKNIYFKFSMEKPIGEWKETDQFNKLLIEIGGFEFTENDVAKFIRENARIGFSGESNSIGLVKYFENSGKNIYRPTISVHAKLYETKSFVEFVERITNINSYFRDKVPKSLKIEVDPTIVKISGIESVHFAYSVKTNISSNNEEYTYRSFVYAIPLNDYYFFLSLHDSPDWNVDCTVIFKRLIESIEIGK